MSSRHAFSSSSSFKISNNFCLTDSFLINVSLRPMDGPSVLRIARKTRLGRCSMNQREIYVMDIDHPRRSGID